MNSDNKVEEKLSDGWVLCKSKSTPGRKYYFNRRTGKSSWTKPQAEENVETAKESKKEKYRREKTKREEHRSVLKRKSDSKDDKSVSSHKKQKQETLLPDKHSAGSSKKESPIKPLESSKKESPLKPTPTKNLANDRLSRLRLRLSSEAALKSDEEKSPVKSKQTNKISPKVPQTETKARLDLISPNVNESRCSVTQSPGSDSHQSIPSPSQFFAANKIISSMKAQLPEEYTNKLKPKDTFADIEEGISKQTPEYPSTKHPATPPQFSEASKLVSAIKSKLSYKISPKDTTVKQFASAKDRMEALRKSLNNEDLSTNEAITACFLSKRELPKRTEAMDVEESKDLRNVMVKQNTGSSSSVSVKENVVLVVDTNIFIHELDVIKNVINSHIKGYTEQPTLLVPWRVINELDRLKDNNNGNGAICKRARAAMDYLYKSLPETDRIRGQSLRDSNSHIYPCESPDDEILNCCLQQAERGKSVILLSNDKNLCNKAMTNSVKCIGLDQLKPLLENKPQPVTDPDLCASVQHYKDHMYPLLSSILENEMRAKYNNLWQRVVFKPPPWTLANVLQCLLKHWIAVFSEVFPRIEHLLADTSSALRAIETKEPNSLSQSEVSNFKELCLELAKKCQIIPEYMELAKLTVERLCRPREHDSPQPVIDAFEGLWTVFSSYCAKLATNLNIPHSLEDKLPSNVTLPDLTSKWTQFCTQISELTLAMSGALTIEQPNDHRFEAQVSRMEAVFKESSALVDFDMSVVNKRNMRVFCTNCRGMLQEACAKFRGLGELLAACSATLAGQ